MPSASVVVSSLPAASYVGGQEQHIDVFIAREEGAPRDVSMQEVAR